MILRVIHRPNAVKDQSRYRVRYNSRRAKGEKLDAVLESAGADDWINQIEAALLNATDRNPNANLIVIDISTE